MADWCARADSSRLDSIPRGRINSEVHVRIKLTSIRLECRIVIVSAQIVSKGAGSVLILVKGRYGRENISQLGPFVFPWYIDGHTLPRRMYPEGV
jgi:hypothetical protein